jgi:uncharacterized protein (DUF1015 family)
MVSRNAIATPIDYAWVSTTGETGDRNYDEFQSESEITAIIRQRPTSIMAVEMPHCTPEMLAKHATWEESQHFAAHKLATMKASHLFKPATHMMFLYEILNRERGIRLSGIGAMFSIHAIWDQHTNPEGKIIRNEDVFMAKVEGRRQLMLETKHMCSAVTLAVSDPAETIKQLIRETTETLGTPDVLDHDHLGNDHHIWIVQESKTQRSLLDALSEREFVVADGNHRSLAAQLSGLRSFLGVAMSAETMVIGPYNRLFQTLEMSKTDFLERLQRAGMRVSARQEPQIFTSRERHHLGLYFKGQSYEMLPTVTDVADFAEQLDHQLIEERIIKGILEMDPGDPRIRYVGAEYGPHYLQHQVDSGACQCVLTVPPVMMEDFLKVNALRKKMPRKSTWFTPKMRAGLVLAENEFPDAL